MTEVRLITFRSAIFARWVRISSCTPPAKNAFSVSRLRFSNGSTAMLFSGTFAGAAFSEGARLCHCGNNTNAAVASAIRPAARANRRAVFQRSRIWARHSCNFEVSARTPGRAAGSRASIETSSEIRRLGTRAALSCPIGRTCSWWLARISSTLAPGKGMRPVSRYQSVAPNE